MTSEKHIRDRLGSVLFRLTAIERRAAEVTEPARAAARLTDDVRKLTGELERAFSDVREVLDECARLETALAVAASRTHVLFELVPVACLFLDAAGSITDANPEAVKLLNVSRRHLVGRSFHLYLGGQRDLFLKRLGSLTDGQERHTWTASVRPRERSPIQSTFTAAPNPAGGAFIAVQPVDGLPNAPVPRTGKARDVRQAPSA